jgi:Rrf2 family cysteine metabolism transcriptional repressor
MALLSRKVDYALLILSYLHHRPEGGSAREVAERFGLSRPFVANILKRLCHKGFVISHRGIKGGYLLGRPAGEVCLAEVMAALDDSFHLAECNKEASGEPCCLMPICPVRGAIAAVHQRLRDVLRDVTLADLFRSPACGTTQFGLEVGTRETEWAVLP